MSKKLQKLSKIAYIALIVLISLLVNIQTATAGRIGAELQAVEASSDGTHCEKLGYAYTVEGRTIDGYRYFYRIDLNSGDIDNQWVKNPIVNVANGNPVDVNAIGFNSNDGFFYGVIPDIFGIGESTPGRLWQLDYLGNARTMGTLTQLPATDPNHTGWFAGASGVVNPNILWISFNIANRIYKVDVSPGITASTRVKGSLVLSREVEWNDFAFSKKNGYIYGWDSATHRVVRVNPGNGQVENISDSIGFAGAVGSAWFYTDSTDSSKNVFYMYFNGGQIKKIRDVEKFSSSNKATIADFEPAFNGRAVTRNDGASCPDNTDNVIDVCPNIPGNQTKVPDGYMIDEKGNCVQKPIPYYPWLQTLKGDVTSLGSVTGQVIGDINAPGEKLGARHADPNNKPATGTLENPEAEYVIASVISGSSGGQLGTNFCSKNLFTLGQNLSERKNCTTGGYTSSDSDISKLESSITSTWGQNGAGSGTSCSPYNTASVSLASVNTDISLGCANGGMQKASGGTLTLNSPISGRGTLWVDGDLTISSNINYLQALIGIQPFQMSNLAIFVKGNINIDQSVTNIDASLVATGSINTCAQESNTASNICSNPLTIRGYLASQGMNSFARRFYNSSLPNINPAEKLILTGQSYAFPPPGFSRSDSDTASQLQINTGEFAPRIK